MKLLVMCEGPNELEVMKILLRHRCLKFTNDDLLNLVPYHAEYFDGNVQLLVDSIREYKRVRGTA